MKHITDVVTHFKGEIWQWDVVNEAVYNMVKRLRAQGVPIDGVGSQGYLGTEYGNHGPFQVADTLGAFTDLGLATAFTEVDAGGPRDALRRQPPAEARLQPGPRRPRLQRTAPDAAQDPPEAEALRRRGVYRDRKFRDRLPHDQPQ